MSQQENRREHEVILLGLAHWINDAVVYDIHAREQTQWGYVDIMPGLTFLVMQEVGRPHTWVVCGFVRP